jgi:uncharacterized protein
MISATKKWLDSFIIDHEICPFAKQERDSNRIRFIEDKSLTISGALEHLIIECELLDKDKEVETTLFILEKICQDFEDFLDFLETANQLLIKQGYEGIYQLASFHPDYCFANEVKDDPANYTNRSPYPMLHIIREESLEKALNNYPSPELIPERNINYCREMGSRKLQKILLNCIEH